MLKEQNVFYFLSILSDLKVFFVIPYVWDYIFKSIGLPSGQLSVTKLKDEPATPKRGLTRSNSSPNIAKMLFDEEQAPKTRPVVDRGAKPQPR